MIPRIPVIPGSFAWRAVPQQQTLHGCQRRGCVGLMISSPCVGRGADRGSFSSPRLSSRAWSLGTFPKGFWDSIFPWHGFVPCWDKSGISCRTGSEGPGVFWGGGQEASPCTASELRGHRIPAHSPSGSLWHRSLQPGTLCAAFGVGLAPAAWGRWSKNLPPPLLPLPEPISAGGLWGISSSAPAALLAVGEGKRGLLPPRPSHEGG